MDWQQILTWIDDKVDQRLQGVLGTALAGVIIFLLCAVWRWLKGKEEPLNQTDQDVLKKLDEPDGLWNAGTEQISTPGLLIAFSPYGTSLSAVNIGSKKALDEKWLSRRGQAEILVKAKALRDRVIKSSSDRERRAASEEMFTAKDGGSPIKQDPVREQNPKLIYPPGSCYEKEEPPKQQCRKV